MGMNLQANNENYEGCEEFNWTGWRTIRELLISLGCDTSEMSTINNGDEISKETCEKWAKLIYEALENDSLVSIRATIITRGASIPMDMLQRSDKEWLLKHAKFFETCGGCKQW